jgi:hypothetical protein
LFVQRLVGAPGIEEGLMRGIFTVWPMPAIAVLIGISTAFADIPRPAVESQPLAANVKRLLSTLEMLGAPLEQGTTARLQKAIAERDAGQLQSLLDSHVLLVVSINPELRMKLARGPATARIQQHGFTPVLVKVLNDGTVTGRLNIHSPQAGSVFDGASDFSLQRQQQTELNRDPNTDRGDGRFLDVEMFRDPPMTPNLSGLQVEYALALVGSSQSGRREATIAFDIGQGTQDLGFRGEVPILFDVAPAIPVTLKIRDHDGSPTTARLTFRDASGRVLPPQAKRVAPDFFFQPQIYRPDGGTVLLPPGQLTMTSSRGPEYVLRTRQIDIPAEGEHTLEIDLKRWIDTMDHGFYCGDHHIHGAGCAHYEFPTQGVSPADMFLQVQGEGLNVGCVLTWGPCFDFQRRYFSPVADEVSQPLTLLKYDLEISGFGSAPMGHVCLLNLTDQTFPGTDGSTEGWPTWTVPVLRWAKQQAGVTGFPHSAMGTQPDAAAQRLLKLWDANGDRRLTSQEAAPSLLPEAFAAADTSRDGLLDAEELTAACDRASDRLPNLVVPEMTGGGAMEIVVAVPEGVCDFISAMDTERIGEWNTWYHLLNCGFPLKLSGETDFPCMSSRRVGQGRVYVQLGPREALDFTEWCNALADGRSYVSDGYAHALRFTVDGTSPGERAVQLAQPRQVRIEATLAFAEEMPEGVAYGTQSPSEGRRAVGDTRILHADRSSRTVRPGKRLVEVIVNGDVVARREVPADGRPHAVAFDVEIARSSWVAVRQFPQLHTNPVDVLVAARPIRASADSARWCHDAVEQLWQRRSRLIAEHERPAAHAAYEGAKQTYRQIAREAAEN